MELLVFFVFLLGFLALVSALIFKVAMMYQKVSELNILIAQMREAGISEEAEGLVWAYHHKQQKR
jgi:hypothetical protein